MAYEKQNFKDDQTLEAEHLNHMEEGIAAAHEQSGGAGVTIDLLWENPNAVNDDDGLNPFEGSVDLPAADYDYFEIVFFRGFENTVSVRAYGGNTTSAEYWMVDARGLHRCYRFVSVNADEEKVYFSEGTDETNDFYSGGGGTEHSNTILVPYLIYGIKGVNKSIVEGKFTIDGEEFTFVKGWDWGKWCESQYNTIGLYATADYVMGDGGNSTLGLAGVGAVDTRESIIDGGNYELL